MSGSRIRMDFIRILVMATKLIYLIPALAVVISGCSGTSGEPDSPVSEGDRKSTRLNSRISAERGDGDLLCP